MQNYRKYELHTLIDVLADETSRYTKMKAANIISGEEFEPARDLLWIFSQPYAGKKMRKGIAGFNEEKVNGYLLLK